MQQTTSGLPSWEQVEAYLTQLGPGITVESWTTTHRSTSWTGTTPIPSASLPSLGQDEKESAVLTAITGTLALMSEAITEELSRTSLRRSASSRWPQPATWPSGLRWPFLLTLVALGSLAAGVASLR